MANWGRDFATGLQSGMLLGGMLRQNRDEDNKRAELAKIANLQPEAQTQTRPATEAEIALAKDPNDVVSQQILRENAEFGVGYNPADYLPANPMGSDIQSWKLGNTVYGARPTQGLIAAEQMKARGRVQEQFGDAEKGATLVAKGEDMRLKEIENIGKQAMQAGTYQAVEDAYNLIYNGKKLKRVDLGGGRYRVLHGPIGAPDSLFDPVIEGTEPEILDFAAKNLDSKTWADLRDQESQIKYRDKLGSHYDWQRQKAEQEHQLETYRRQIDAIDEILKMTPPDAVEETAKLLQERERLMQTWAGMSQGLRGPVSGGTQNLGSAQGLSKNTTQWRPVVEDATRNLRYVTPDLALAVIQQESNGNATAMSPAGAIGLMQLMPGTARDLGVSNPYDPIANIRGGVRYLDDLIARYDGDVQKGLMAYNWGMGNVDKHLAGQSTGVPRETQNYVPGVMSRFGGAPQQGLTTAPNATAAAPAADPRFMRIAEARREAARMPKPGKEPSVAEMIQLRNAAIEELGTTLESIKKPEERQRLISQKMDEIRGDIGAGGYDAVGSMGQIANGTAKDNAGGLTGSDFATVSKAAATGVRKGVNDSALAKEQAKFDQRVQSHANSLRALESTKASNPEEAKRQAQAALADIEGLYPNLTAAGKQAAATALNGIYRLFPELAPQP